MELPLTKPAAQAVEDRIFRRISEDISASSQQVKSAVALLDEGATVPFVARYRKEVTGGLDDIQLRTLADRLTYLRDMEARRDTILNSIKDQGKLTDDLARAIAGADNKATLEDIYLPYKPKRRTKAMIARENGLEPLLRAIQENRAADPEGLAAVYVTETVATVKDALNGARDILTEELSENADLLGRLRDFMQREAFISSRVIEGKEKDGAKFSDYFAHREKWADIAAHRALAILRAAKEEVVIMEITPDAEEGVPRAISMVAAHLDTSGDAPGDKWLRAVAGWAWRIKFSMSLYVDLLSDLRQRAHEEAILVFSRNLKDLLLAAPAGRRATLGLDPGIRTGVKVAAIDDTGKVLDTATIYPFQPRMDVRGSEAKLLELITKHGIELIAVGNGTGSRETEKLVAETLKLLPKSVKAPMKVVVSEAGASVYSASELASEEFPDLDVSLRGAVSIARRLQDPLAELVKITPKSIGVGQYQHDVDQRRLGNALEAVVEDAVNAVGVDLNTASAPLLAQVAGLGRSLAGAIVFHRDMYGAFPSRKSLLKVSGLGPKAFEQAAGFLRIRDGVEPLDASSVHPEAYDVAQKIVTASGRNMVEIMGQSHALKTLKPENFVTDNFGLPTVRDIFTELEKPGRDPRPEFKTATFTDGVEAITDLKPGMRLEGTVTNVAAFGAFVDIGVHQDGLVHISQLADRFVKDPHDVVKAGDVVRVMVTEVEVARKRIALSMRKDAKPGGNDGPKERNTAPRNQGRQNNQSSPRGKSGGKQQTGGFGDALLSAMNKKK
ncbi:Tex family protein [Thalassobius sp. I31.1]|uniref:Tex family protein n=1 Tax=Thalassobius sp. I31.1 TaxID=2109912 RepID=UPI000D1B12CF|nr:Tex family protein [Thalassobius sp. I31.1]